MRQLLNKELGAVELKQEFTGYAQNVLIYAWLQAVCYALIMTIVQIFLDLHDGISEWVSYIHPYIMTLFFRVVREIDLNRL